MTDTGIDGDHGALTGLAPTATDCRTADYSLDHRIQT